MNDTMKAAEASYIPAPLRDWLDHAIITQMSESETKTENTLQRRASIANAILYPLENTPRRPKERSAR